MSEPLWPMRPGYSEVTAHAVTARGFRGVSLSRRGPEGGGG
ncbi:hypothetical protein [Enterobacter cloacae]|nr:hypothetical protein [Enterobacter cloacae]